MSSCVLYHCIVPYYLSPLFNSSRTLASISLARNGTPCVFHSPSIFRRNLLCNRSLSCPRLHSGIRMRWNLLAISSRFFWNGCMYRRCTKENFLPSAVSLSCAVLTAP